MTVVAAQPLAPMPLPDDLLPAGEQWHPATVRWWERWCESPLAQALPSVDWSELEATAVLHHQYMARRTFNLAAELRLRMAEWGATPAARARLRIQVVDAEVAERKLGQTSGAASEKFADLRVLPTPKAAGDE